MRLLTEEQFTRLFDNGRRGGFCRDWLPVVMLELPGTGCTWLLSEIVHRNYRLYGYGITDLGKGSIEDGLIDLGLLELMSDPMQIHHVRQVKDFVPLYPISVYQTAARMYGGITCDPEALQEAQDYLDAADALAERKMMKMHRLQP